MAAVFPLVIWIISIGVSVCVLTLTKSSGLTPEAKKARTMTIAWGFAPFYGIELLIQAYFFAKYKRGSAGARALDSISASFDSQPARPAGSSQASSTQLADQPASSAAQSQQSNNPFL